MRKFIIILIALVLFGKNIKAQVPGYLGKRFSVGYAYTLSPLAYWGDVKTTDGKDLKITSVNYRHNIEVNWAIKDRAYIGLNYSYQKWGVITNLLEDGELSSINSNITNFTIPSDFGVSDFKYINASSNKFTLFYGTTRGIAPRGSYAAFGLSLERITPQVTDVENKVVDLTSINNYGIAFRVGKRRVFYDKIMIDVAANVELGAGVFNLVGDYNKFNRNFNKVNDNGNFSTLTVEELNKKAKTQASYYSLLSLRVGLYYLL
jgi:hypothetical protein